MLNEMEPEQMNEFVVQEICAPEFVDDWGLEEFEELGIDPQIWTGAKPGSEEKVLMLSARYAAGVPLWNNSDCYDHGPGLDNQEEGSLEDSDSELPEDLELPV